MTRSSKKTAVSAAVLEKKLRKLGTPAKAQLLSGFFKTGPGQYGEGDIFFGVPVPRTRELVKGLDLSFQEARKALNSPYHEVRLAGLMILTEKFRSSDEAGRKNIFDFYMANSERVNNWDLVDSSAHHIAGSYLENKDRSLLYRFAKSENLWQRRIAIVSTWHEIRAGRFAETLKISEMLLGDKHDLIHKACGWMLREADKKKPGCIDGFLKKHQKFMPRTMLRYAVERFSKEKKKKVMAGKF